MIAMNIDRHIARMNANGNTVGESLGSSTKNSINYLFKDSPFYRIIKIENEDVEVRISERAGLTNIKSSQYKSLTFRPDSKFNLGDIAEFNDEEWMIIDFTDNDIFPLASIQRVNEQLRWLDREGNLITIPCIVNKSPLDRIFVKDNRHDVPVVDQMMYVLIKHDDMSRLIVNGQRFILGSQAYLVNGIDDLSYVHKDKGVVQLILSFSNKKNKDDMVNKIADNSHLYKINESDVPDNPIDPPDDDGGDWW